MALCGLFLGQAGIPDVAAARSFPATTADTASSFNRAALSPIEISTWAHWRFYTDLSTAPTPVRLIGIHLPRPTKKELEKINKEERKAPLLQSEWRFVRADNGQALPYFLENPTPPHPQHNTAGWERAAHAAMESVVPHFLNMEKMVPMPIWRFYRLIVTRKTPYVMSFIPPRRDKDLHEGTFIAHPKAFRYPTLFIHLLFPHEIDHSLLDDLPDAFLQELVVRFRDAGRFFALWTLKRSDKESYIQRVRQLIHPKKHIREDIGDARGSEATPAQKWLRQLHKLEDPNAEAHPSHGLYEFFAHLKRHSPDYAPAFEAAATPNAKAKQKMATERLVLRILFSMLQNRGRDPAVTSAMDRHLRTLGISTGQIKAWEKVEIEEARFREFRRWIQAHNIRIHALVRDVRRWDAQLTQRLTSLTPETLPNAHMRRAA